MEDDFGYMRMRLENLLFIWKLEVVCVDKEGFKWGFDIKLCVLECEVGLFKEEWDSLKVKV